MFCQRTCLILEVLRQQDSSHLKDVKEDDDDEDYYYCYYYYYYYYYYSFFKFEMLFVLLIQI